MKLIGYGEDGLTAWALIHRFDLVVKGLSETPGETLESANWTVFYRPSVGRGIGGSIGEFDAIICTEASVYLVESKWEDRKSKGPRRGPLKLDKTQVNRHIMFEWIKNRWQDRLPQEGWTEFAASYQGAFGQEFPSRRLPRSDRRLASNLTFLLERTKNRSIKHVLLYFFSE